ncbi:MAG: hypothetical protein Q8761_02785 [Sweet potato little leaf phytoplasma]|nr:hypothetical protein [Sweet potato little leaf phytoplasma]
MEHCSSQEQITDVFTKSLSLEKFTYLREKLGVCIKGANVTD